MDKKEKFKEVSSLIFDNVEIENCLNECLKYCKLTSFCYGGIYKFQLDLFDYNYKYVGDILGDGFKERLAKKIVQNEIKLIDMGHKVLYVDSCDRVKHTITIAFDDRGDVVDFINNVKLIVKQLERDLKDKRYLDSLAPIKTDTDPNKPKNKEFKK